MSEKTCEERIHDQAVVRGNHLADLFERMSADEYDEEAHDEYHDLPLSIETTRTIRVLFSTGGPADGLNVELDAAGEIRRVVYWFADWFDHAETTIPEGASLYRYAQDLVEMGYDCQGGAR